MPEEMTFRPRPELLQDDEIYRLVDIFAGLGFDKIRLTGGEPTVRANVVEIVEYIASRPGINTVAMTTNGLLLNKLARPLAQAGLSRVNISIDTLDPQKFRKLTRWGDVQDVWAGIDAAETAGLKIKLNAVVVRGYNDQEDVVDLARLTLFQSWQVRFIEMMPFGDVAEFQLAQVITSQAMRATIEARLGPLVPVDGGRLDGEARLYRLAQGQGDVGFISSVTEPFCAFCTRARLTADGKLRMCLLRDYEMDLLTPLRAGAGVDELKALITKAVYHKPWGHGLAHNVVPRNRVMSEIGG